MSPIMLTTRCPGAMAYRPSPQRPPTQPLRGSPNSHSDEAPCALVAFRPTVSKQASHSPRYACSMDAKAKTEELILSVAALVRDAAHMGDAALAGDFDEARFRAQLIAAKADVGGHIDLALAAAHLVMVLGAPGSLPGDGYGAGILRVAHELDRIGFTPL